MNAKIPRIAITLGDPAGIGGELVAKLLAKSDNLKAADIVLVSDTMELLVAAKDAGLPKLKYVSSTNAPDPEQGVPKLFDNASARPASTVAGFKRKEATLEGGQWTLANLDMALQMARKGDIDAILYAPLNKSSLHLAGMRHKDELHYFAHTLDRRNASADASGEGFACEINVLPNLMTSRVTSHLSLAEVSPLITRENVLGATKLLCRILTESRPSDATPPRLGVCALNPHAGENGAFGRQEIDVIAPAVKELAASGMNVQGPFPGDTIFVRARNGEFDGVVTMFHDQGQTACKLIGFESAVTLSGGLQVPICTPAHGTAFDLVGRGGLADMGAMQHAFNLAVRLGKEHAEKR